MPSLPPETMEASRIAGWKTFSDVDESFIIHYTSSQGIRISLTFFKVAHWRVINERWLLLEEMKLNGWFVRDKEIMVKILKAGNILHQYVPILRPGGGETSSKSLCFMLFFDKNRPSLFKDFVAVGEDIRLCTGVRLGDDEWCQDLKVEAYRNLLSFMCKPTQEGEQQQRTPMLFSDIRSHRIESGLLGLPTGRGELRCRVFMSGKRGRSRSWSEV